MRFSKKLIISFFGLMLVSTALYSTDKTKEAVDEIYAKSLDVISEGLSEEDKSALDQIIKKKPQILDDIDKSISQNFKEVTKELKKSLSSSVVKNAWDVLEKASAVNSGNKSSNKEQKKKDFDTYVFISLSMPEASLRSVFEEAVYQRKLGYKIAFVTRGWKQHEFTKTISRFAKLWPSVRDKNQIPEMITHPELFKEMDIETVPVIAHKNNRGVWKTIKGSVNLQYAFEKLEEESKSGMTIGPLYEIEEPNLLDVIKDAIAKHNWKKDVEKARNRIYEQQFAKTLPNAKISESYLVDLTIQVKSNMRSPTGEVFAQKGERLNPLNFINVPFGYIFIDGTNPKHRKIARKWAQRFPRVIYIATKLPGNKLSRALVVDEMGQDVKLVNQMLINKFKLKAVPSLVEQDGMMMRVTTKIAL